MSKCIGVVVLFCISLASAQLPTALTAVTETGGGGGIRAQTLGQAHMAAADDYSALFWNPAALTLLKGAEVGIHPGVLDIRSKTTENGNRQSHERTNFGFSTVGAAYRFDNVLNGLTVALGYDHHRSYEHVFAPEGLPMHDNLLEGRLKSLSLGFGLALSPRFSLGMTLSRFTGSSSTFSYLTPEEIDLAFPSDTTGNHFSLSQWNELSNTQLKLGMLVQVAPQFRLGLAVDLPVAMTVDYNHLYERYVTPEGSVISLRDSAVIVDQRVLDYTASMPLRLSLGAAWQYRNLMLMASGAYADWSSVRYDLPAHASPSDEAFFDENHFRAVLSLGLGVEYILPKGALVLRGGYRHHQSSLRDAASRQNRHLLSVGVGVPIGQYAQCDLGYSHTRYDLPVSGSTWQSVRLNQYMAGLTVRLPR